MNYRCTTPTKVPGHTGHCERYMLDPAYARTPRDLADMLRAIDLADQESSIDGAEDVVKPYGIWPVKTALMLMDPYMNQYLQTVWDTLHVFDGGVTNRNIVLAGNWYYRIHADGGAALALLNERLAAMPKHDDFTRFLRPFLSVDTESGSTRPVKTAVNFRCEEYRQLIQQIMYIWPNIT